ncbi:DUF1456 family protein [Sporosarcina sp. Marseille-Q4943]|uniref:DUF1456 family protein n=1 Tax=Sporosarcina sp. Marseille-Q4943 TaxID=2942204 RepID=UPI00208DC32B|nr:DUF1456 family protein [Sporosarcina sp. Marseille-Q4943]
MNNNDRLIRLRYALDFSNTEMVDIFKLGGVEVTKEDVILLLTKSTDDETENEIQMKCTNQMLDSFLNGLIIYKRGKQDSKPGQPQGPAITNESVNNILLKKVKIALALTSEDMLEILEDAGITISKGELSAVLRKEGHKNYKPCLDRYARNFLKGLAIKYRA